MNTQLQQQNYWESSAAYVVSTYRSVGCCRVSAVPAASRAACAGYD